MPAPIHQVQELAAGWQVAGCAPGEHATPGTLEGLDWLAAQCPGTAAGALRAAGRWSPGDPRDFDAYDWWFRVRFAAAPADAGEQLVLALDGIATAAEVYLNGELVLESESMFAAHTLDVTERVTADNELAIRCLALAPLLAVTRRPRARWRTRLVSERNLRFHRTMLIGRAPGFAPSPAPVGPWKPVRLERRRRVVARELRLRAGVGNGDGRLNVRGVLEALDGALPVSVTVELSGPTGVHTAVLGLQPASAGLRIEGQMVVPQAELWWPHTHGTPALYEARLRLDAGDGDGDGELSLPAGRVGFRALDSPGELDGADGLALHVNGVPLFARGAVWTPLDPTSPCSRVEDLRPVLAAVVAAGMNMLRVPGVGAYEGRAFYDLCDELGILVWQDFMFANLDYPDRDPAFMETVAREAAEVLAALGQRPALAVLCGGSEVAQQAAMMGLDPRETGGPLYEELLPAAIAAAEVEVPYVPSTPWGGELPFRPDRGVANYYGVGAYLRPLADARLAGVRFAGECLAFANVPDQDALAELEAAGAAVVHHPLWKAGVPRDAAAGWDFEDVRDHYLRLLYDVDPVALRYADHPRYLELSRHVTGEVMAAVLGEWRRADSPCAGGLVLWLTDLRPGAGWGVLDHRGRPKAAYHYLRRALAPVAVWSTDEGLGGVALHVANDGPQELRATLRVSTYTDFERRVDEVQRPLALAARSACSLTVEGLLGRFVDASWAYRFGPPAQDVIVASLEQPGPEGSRLLAQSFRFPAGWPLRAESADALEVEAQVQTLGQETALVTVSSRRLLYGVRLHVPGYAGEDDAFAVEPGHARRVLLQRLAGAHGDPDGHLSALNLIGRVPLASGS